MEIKRIVKKLRHPLSFPLVLYLFSQLLSAPKLKLSCSRERNIEHEMQHILANLSTNIGY